MLGVASFCVFLSLAHMAVVIPSFFWLFVISLLVDTLEWKRSFIALFDVCDYRGDGRCVAVRVFRALHLAVSSQYDAEAVHQERNERERTDLLDARDQESGERDDQQAACGDSRAIAAVFSVLLPASREIRGSCMDCLLTNTELGKADGIGDEEASIGVGGCAEAAIQRHEGAKKQATRGLEGLRGLRGLGVAKLQTDATERFENRFVLCL